VPVVRRSRTLAATPGRLWDVIGDPHHLPRWWPRVSRVEGVDEHAFTEVLVGEKGKVVRADFRRVEEEPHRRVVWAQEIAGTPFARVLDSAETEIVLSVPQGASASTESSAGAESSVSMEVSSSVEASAATDASASTEVTIELRQEMKGFDFGSRLGLGALTRSGSYLVRRAAVATVEEALDGLERAVVG
jgi:uncharacterized protein YndB with AHSA1/START domain